ncbi:ABC transporter substrate-binding protein [Pseudarthrobacter albicanus]|uniref:ABC transporter substrate-binding protein n=1 Tax=Pseudarthrobacter albicanus TaxID=2823873 RepID=UPI001BADCA3F|nr:ABC transporter substrate-binding protein [Pseudarthrobacter albicanus]
MSHPIDVGSVLGGRYKVTATVLTSHDQDLVLDGVDQVLNRDVSILVAGPENADQVAQSAREVATGERPGQMQILDLGVSESTTYLITNHASAADLLDLVVSSNPPYVEPFFTDTLGSEIFGQARSQEPETYDGLYDDEEVDAGYINYGQNRPQQPGQQAAVPPVPPSRVPPAAVAGPSVPAAGGGAAVGAAAAGAAGLGAGAAASASPDTAPQETAPQPTAPHPLQDGAAYRPAGAAAAPVSSPPAEEPKVSLWSGDDYDYDAAGQPAHPAQEEYVAGPYVAGPPATAGAGRNSLDRAPGNFPASARDHDSAADDDYYGKDDEPRREPRSARWLVGGLLAAVLVVGMIFAVTNLGSLFKSSPPPAAGGTSSSSAPGQSSAPPSGTASPAPVAGPPAIEGVTRLGNFDFAATYDVDLGKTFDGNGASYWSDMEFASDNWGGFATEVPLVIKLKSPSKVSSVTLSQLGGSGGSISVFTNDRPALDGAKQVGVNSFTSPDLTMPLPEPVTAQYVIVSIKSLPKLAAPKTRFGYGLRLAEVKVQ